MKSAALALLFSCFPASFGYANSDRESAVYSVFNAVIDARFDHEFDRLADLMHPASLQLWRKVMNVEYERLVEKFSITEVQSTIGLTTSPLDSELSDAALFRKLASRAFELDPNFVGPEEILPLKVHGVIFDDDDRAWLTFDFKSTHKSKRSTVTARNPRVHTFRRNDWAWRLHTTILTAEVSAVWHDAMIGRRRNPPNRPSITLPTPLATKAGR